MTKLNYKNFAPLIHNKDFREPMHIFSINLHSKIQSIIEKLKIYFEKFAKIESLYFAISIFEIS